MSHMISEVPDVWFWFTSAALSSHFFIIRFRFVRNVERHRLLQPDISLSVWQH